MKFKRILSFFLCLTAVLVLIPATQADGEIYFTAVNDVMLDLSDSSMPYKPLSGIIYIPASVFDSAALGISFVQNKEKMTATLFNRDVTITFDLGRGIAYDKDNAKLSGKATSRGGMIFVPAAFVCQEFGLTYSYIDMGEAISGAAYDVGIVRIKNSAAVLNDSMFSKSVTDSMKSRYDTYMRNKYPPTSSSPPSATASMPPSPSPSPQPAQKQVYLTFDDGPNSATPLILDILEEYGVKATFFLQGVNMPKGEDSIRRIVASGHSIGIHSFTHDAKIFYSNAEAMLEELRSCNEYLYMIANVKTRILRVPYGSDPHIRKKPELSEALVGAGYRYWDWNIDSQDALSGATAEKIIENAISGLKAMNTTAVLLMHDKKITAEALPAILDYIMSENYVISVISESDRPINWMSEFR